MKLKTSFCNATVLKKDLTRFLPFWGIYLIGGLLVCSTFSGSYYWAVADSVAEILRGGMPFISGGYALVAALLMFGDLFNSRMCNMLHAMPPRRETWFCTHFIAGILMSAVPNLVLSLVLMPMLDSLWYVALVWAGVSTLEFFFFFSVALLSIMATGNRFASIIVFGLVNFFAYALLWLYAELIYPFLYGLRDCYDTTFLTYLCPAVRLLSYDLFTLVARGTVASDQDPTYGYPLRDYTLQFEPEGWIYLGVLAAVGVVLTVIAVLLYRRRKLECAGDFAAIAPTRWAVAIFGSLVCGMVFRLFSIDDVVGGYLLLFIGITVGFYLLQMLLQRKVKVFTRRTCLKLICLILCVALVLIGGAVDILGIESYVPRADQVQSVVVADCYLPDKLLDYIDGDDTYFFASSYSYATLTDPEDVECVLQSHRLAIREGECTTRQSQWITLHYRLKGGRTVTRSYHVNRSGECYKSIKPFFSGPEYIFGAESKEVLIASLNCIYVEGIPLPNAEAANLAELLWLDAENGLLNAGNGDSYLELELVLSSDYNYHSCYVSLPAGTESYRFLQKLMPDSADTFFAASSPDTIANGLRYASVNGSDIDLDFAVKLVYSLWDDANRGLLGQFSAQHESDSCVEVYLVWTTESGHKSTASLLVYDDAVSSWPLIKEIMGGNFPFSGVTDDVTVPCNAA